MAEAHSAVAFSFHVTPEGLNVRYNHEAIKAVWYSGIRSWKLRFVRFKNHLINTLYPAPPISLFLISAIVTSAQLYTDTDLSYGLVDKISTLFPDCVHDQCEIITALLFGFGVWVAYVLARRYSLKLLLMNHSWMYEPFGRISWPNKIWIGLVKFLQGRDPLLYGYQSALPKLPVPSLEGAKTRAADSKREEFRKYLEKGGVLDFLTKILVGLYEEPEKPNDALDFIKQHMGADGPETADVESLKLEVTELRQKCEQLTEENGELKSRIAQLEPPTEESAMEN